MINLLALTVTATTDLASNTVCRFDGGYDGTKPYLGVVMFDANTGSDVTVTCAGTAEVAIRTGETIAVGDLVGIDATGKATAPGSADKVADFKYALATDGTFVTVLLN